MSSETYLNKLLIINLIIWIGVKLTVKKIWEKRWDEKFKNVTKSTSLDFFAQKAYSILIKYIKNDHRKILEIGSGTGRFCIALAKKFPDKDIIGIDYTDEAINLSKEGVKHRKLTNVQFYKNDLFNLPYKDNSFDFVFENGVIEHFINYEDAIKEMIRVTKVGGTVIVNTNNWYCLPKTFEKKFLGKHYHFGYEKSFKHKELFSSFKNLGLKNVEVYAYNPFNYIVRFFFFSNSIKNIIAYIAILLENFLNAVSFNKFSRKFGYMIFAIGNKWVF